MTMRSAAVSRRLPGLSRLGTARGRFEKWDDSLGSATLSGSTRGSNEPLEDPQIAGVQVLSLFDSLGCFQNHRQVPEPGVIDQVPERFQTHATSPDCRVAID